MKPTTTWNGLYLPIVVLVVTIASLLLLLGTAGNIGIAMVPLAVLFIFFLLTTIKTEKIALFSFIFLLFALDDAAGLPWGPVTPITESLGYLMSGMGVIKLHEILAWLFLIWTLLTLKPEAKLALISEGLLATVAFSSIILIGAMLAGIYGLNSGGNVLTYFIQIRFLYLLPLWTIIGFIYIRTPQMADGILKIITLAMIFKGIQGCYMYVIHRDVFGASSNEYLIDHWVSAFFVMAVVYLVVSNATPHLTKKRKIFTFSLCIPIMISYFLNDRRTSLIALFLALVCLPLLWPFSELKKRLPVLFKTLGIIMVFATLTWPIPGRIGNTIRSFSEAKEGIPDSRHKENYNIFLNLFTSPTMGLGLGKELIPMTPMDDVTHIYKRVHMLPHNALLSFWAFTGFLGMAALSTYFSIFFAKICRLIMVARDRRIFIFALIGYFFGWQYLIYTNADIGLGQSRLVLLSGLFWGGVIRLSRFNARLEKKMAFHHLDERNSIKVNSHSVLDLESSSETS